MKIALSVSKGRTIRYYQPAPLYLSKKDFGALRDVCSWRKMMFVKKLFYIGSLFLVLMSSAQAKPIILSSIKPLSLIAQEIAGENARVDTLLPITASPHDYPLKVSDYTRLKKADLILWIGPELESFLQKPLSNLQGARVMTAYTLEGMHWPEEKNHVNELHHHERDPHLWLDPRNAIVIAQALNEKLSKIDALHEQSYRENLQKFTEKMIALDVKLLADLKPLAAKGFVVYHEGYSHFVGRYNLHQLDYFVFTPEQRPGAKHLGQLRDKLAREGKCIFSEPYFDLTSVEKLSKDLRLNRGVLDAIGNRNINSYTQLLLEMAQAFSVCLLL
jgi:zinc transport system substrate-binding protein